MKAINVTFIVGLCCDQPHILASSLLSEEATVALMRATEAQRKSDNRPEQVYRQQLEEMRVENASPFSRIYGLLDSIFGNRRRRSTWGSRNMYDRSPSFFGSTENPFASENVITVNSYEDLIELLTGATLSQSSNGDDPTPMNLTVPGD